jgi:hypothetical protein
MRRSVVATAKDRPMTSIGRIVSTIALATLLGASSEGAAAQVAAVQRATGDIEVERHLDLAGEALAHVGGYGCSLSNKPEAAADARLRTAAARDLLDAAMLDAETKIGRKMKIRLWVSQCQSFMNEERVRAGLETAQQEIEQANALMREGRPG